MIEIIFLFRLKAKKKKEGRKKKKVIDTLIQDQFKANVIHVVML